MDQTVITTKTLLPTDFPLLASFANADHVAWGMDMILRDISSVNTMFGWDVEGGAHPFKLETRALRHAAAKGIALLYLEQYRAAKAAVTAKTASTELKALVKTARPRGKFLVLNQIAQMVSIAYTSLLAAADGRNIPLPVMRDMRPVLQLLLEQHQWGDSEAYFAKNTAVGGEIAFALAEFGTVKAVRLMTKLEAVKYSQQTTIAHPRAIPTIIESSTGFYLWVWEDEEGNGFCNFGIHPGSTYRPYRAELLNGSRSESLIGCELVNILDDQHALVFQEINNRKKRFVVGIYEQVDSWDEGCVGVTLPDGRFFTI